MPDYTSKQLPKPLATDNQDVTVLRSAFDRVNDYGMGAFVCTSTTRPTGSNLWVGLTIYETDTTRTRVWNGANWWQVAGPPVDLALTYVSPYGVGAGSTAASNPIRLFKINKTAYAVGSFKNSGGTISSLGANIQQPFSNLPAAAKPVMDAALAGSNRRLYFPALSVTSGVGFRMGTFIVADDTDQMMFQPGADLSSVTANNFTLGVSLCQWDTNVVS